MTSPSERERAAIYAHYGLTCPPRFATLRNFDNKTYGPRLAKIGAKLGTPFNPWQRYVADTSLEIDSRTGLFVYRGVGCTVPRQSGKTSLILPLCCHRGMAWPRQRITYAAQNGTAAREKWEDDQLPALAAAGFVPGDGERLLPKHRARVRRANGREAIIWRKTQSIHGLHANTERAGHGKTLHLGVNDEYFAQVDYRIMAAWSPAMITVEMAQHYWFSTMGTSKSVPMNEDVKRGRELVLAGEPTRTAYFEWSDDEASDRADPLRWLACMPSLCPDPVCRCSPDWRHTVTIATIQAELEAANTPAKLAEFDRAYRNITRDDDQVEADPNVPTVQEWDLLADERAERGEVLAVAIDVSPMGTSSAIVAVGEGPDGLPLLVVLEHGDGMAWVVARAAELKEELNPVAWVLDERAKARELIEPLAKAGIVRPTSLDKFKRGNLWTPSTPDLGAACGTFTSTVKAAKLVHRGQHVMTEAILGARTRPLGDGLTAFGRKVSTADITSLVAGAEALAGYEKFAYLAVDYDPLANIW